MGDHAGLKSAHTKSDWECGICLKYFQCKSSLTGWFRVGVGTLVCKSHKQEGKEILWLDAKFVLQRCKNVLASTLD